MPAEAEQRERETSFGRSAAYWPRIATIWRRGASRSLWPKLFTMPAVTSRPQRGVPPWFAVTVAISLGIVSGALLVHVGQANALPKSRALSILVMGDSYSAGNGAGDYYGAKGCRRSRNNYAEDFARLVQAPPHQEPTRSRTSRAAARRRHGSSNPSTVVRPKSTPSSANTT